MKTISIIEFSKTISLLCCNFQIMHRPFCERWSEIRRRGIWEVTEPRIGTCSSCSWCSWAWLYR
jgi:hypothetical protein